MMQRCVTVGENDIYECAKGQTFKLPDGWDRVDFRFPHVGENYLAPFGSVECRGVNDKGPFGPRIILVAKPEPTEQEVYGRPVAIPAGYKKVAFRRPAIGEKFLSKPFLSVITPADPSDAVLAKPRVIVETLPETPKLLTELNIYGWLPVEIPAGYEKVDFRPPMPDEIFIAKVGLHVTTIYSPMRSLPEDSRIILKRIGEFEFHTHQFVRSTPPSPVKITAATKVLIRSGETYGVMYWKRPQRGYTLNRAEAHRYTLVEAIHAGPYNTYELAGD